MRDYTEWCSKSSISIEDWINKEVADYRMEHDITPTTVFMSCDVYVELMKTVAFESRYFQNTEFGPTLMYMYTNYGPIKIQRVGNLSNFCLVGNNNSFKRVEQSRIDKAFEKAFFEET